MGRSQTTFNKKDREKKKLQKRKDKEAKKQEKREQEKDGSLENMMAYIDEDGNITDTAPDPNKRKKEIKASSIIIDIPKQEKEDPNAEKNGVITFFNDSKGFGFINQKGSDERIFVHSQNANFAMKEGDKVNFKTEKGPQGLIAVEVSLMNE